MCALALMVPVPALATCAAMLWWPETTLGKTLFALSKPWTVLLPLFWMLRIEKRPLSWSLLRRRGVGLGLGTGLVAAVVILGAYALALGRIVDVAAVRELAAGVGLDKPLPYLGGVVYWITINSFVEEYVWRWFVYRQCEKLMPKWAAVLCAALGFTLHHIVAMSVYFELPVVVLGSVGVFAGGALWSWLYSRYNSILPCYVSHVLADIAIFAAGWHLLFAA